MIFSMLILNVYSQKLITVPYYNWSNTNTFKSLPSPLVNGYGPLSDSLSKVHHDSVFYVNNGEYYPITCLADYYNWYVREYWFLFDDPGAYEFAYKVKNNLWMAQYICGNNYHGRDYPTRVAISFNGRYIGYNNLSAENVKQTIKADEWSLKHPEKARNLDNDTKTSSEKIDRNNENNSYDEKINRNYEATVNRDLEREKHNKPGIENNNPNTKNVSNTDNRDNSKSAGSSSKRNNNPGNSNSKEEIGNQNNTNR